MNESLKLGLKVGDYVEWLGDNSGRLQRGMIGRVVKLWTRKKRGGHLRSRKVPMTQRLQETLWKRFLNRDQEKQWVFWHTYWSSKTGKKSEGPYHERKRIMRTLCKKVGVRYFRFHAFRHAGASALENARIPISVIQKFLGHESRITTETYLQTLDEIERKASAIFEREIQKVSHKSHTGRCHGCDSSSN